MKRRGAKQKRRTENTNTDIIGHIDRGGMEAKKTATVDQDETRLPKAKRTDIVIRIPDDTEMMTRTEKGDEIGIEIGEGRGRTMRTIVVVTEVGGEIEIESIEGIGTTLMTSHDTNDAGKKTRRRKHQGEGVEVDRHDGATIKAHYAVIQYFTRFKVALLILNPSNAHPKFAQH